MGGRWKGSRMRLWAWLLDACELEMAALHSSRVALPLMNECIRVNQAQGIGFRMSPGGLGLQRPAIKPETRLIPLIPVGRRLSSSSSSSPQPPSPSTRPLPACLSPLSASRSSLGSLISPHPKRCATVSFWSSCAWLPNDFPAYWIPSTAPSL